MLKRKEEFEFQEALIHNNMFFTSMGDFLIIFVDHMSIDVFNLADKLT